MTRKETDPHTPLPDDVVEREVRINARPETVFPFFTDPALMTRWHAVSAELDPRPGGIFRVNVHSQNIAGGRFVEVIPYSRVVFTFGREGPQSPLPPGASTPSTRTATIPSSTSDTADCSIGSSATLTTRGWALYLDRLAIAAGGGDPGPDPWHQPDEQSPDNSRD